jgi:hypothetical protein
MKQCHCGQFWKSCLSCQVKPIKIKQTKIIKMENKNTKIKLTKEEKLSAAFEIRCSGILYEPQGCTQELGTYKNGCGKCGTGNYEICLNNKFKTDK